MSAVKWSSELKGQVQVEFDLNCTSDYSPNPMAPRIIASALSLVICVTAVWGTPPLQKRDAWSDQVVALHNQYRAQYGASPVAWSGSLYSSTLSYAQGCKFVHSDPQGQYGENLYAGTGDLGIDDALQAWMGEASDYDYNNPGFSSSTGHFTQVVWKSTTEVTCAIADCPAGAIFPSDASHFIVCRYTPPGNVQGQFAENVARPI